MASSEPIQEGQILTYVSHDETLGFVESDSSGFGGVVAPGRRRLRHLRRLSRTSQDLLLQALAVIDLRDQALLRFPMALLQDAQFGPQFIDFLVRAVPRHVEQFARDWVFDR